MTQKEKIESLKGTIEHLYCNEGRSKAYIARLLQVDRKTLSSHINSWNLIQANISYMSPSNQKFINKNRQLIKSRLDQNIPVTKIASELNVGVDYLKKLIQKDEILKKANEEKNNRSHNKAIEEKQEKMDNSTREYIDKKDYLENEIWKPLKGYPGYEVSNMGRIKKYAKNYDKYYLKKGTVNSKSGYVYVTVINEKGKKKNLALHRLIAFNFVEGYTKDKNNTVNHIDGNKENNKAENLEWVSQSVNNSKAYSDLNRTINTPYSKNKKFKEIVITQENGEVYKFKTIRAFAKFYNVSDSQAQRYISGENNFKHKIQFIY